MGIRVVIADDQRLQRDGFRMILDSQDDIEVVGEAGDGEQALALLRRGPVDVLLMDIEMPRMNGLVAAGRVGADERVLAQGRAPWADRPALIAGIRSWLVAACWMRTTGFPRQAPRVLAAVACGRRGAAP